MKKLNIAVFLVFLICLFSIPAQARYSGGTTENPYQISDFNGLMAVRPDSNDTDKISGPEYAPNEIIVKFRPESAATLEGVMAKGVEVDGQNLAGSLGSLSTKYKLKMAQPLFKNFKSNRQRIKQLQVSDESRLSKKEMRILRRLRRAPKNAKVPELDRIYKLEVELEPGQTIEEVVTAYNNDPVVEYAELNYIVSIDLPPNDPLYPIQWPLNNTGQIYPESGKYNHPPGTPDCDIDAPEAWDIYTGSSEVIVAVVDTGVDYNHRDLQTNMWTNASGHYGYDFVNNDSDPIDDHGHGTHCSGIIAAEGNNGLDITGVCWNAKIMALKFLDSVGSGWTSDAVNAFYYAIENGADVTSNSWGGGEYSQFMQDAIDYAYSQGVVMVASAGNNGNNSPYYPSYYNHMISVAATDSNDQKASFSTYGDWVDIAAPGVDVLSLRANGTSMGTTYDNYTTVASGTSMACPHVAGAYALLISINPFLTSDEVYEILTDTVDPISPDICLSGRLNLFNAVKATFGLNLNRDYYSCSDEIYILLADSNFAGQGSYNATLTTSGGDLETALLIEKTPPDGIFEGTVLTNSGAPDIENGILEVSHGDIITATCEDYNDIATIDCEAPAIFNVQTVVQVRHIEVTFETDEPTTARVLYGLSCGGPYIIEVYDLSLSTMHTIIPTGVYPGTDYFFVVEVQDRAGNITVDDNAGLCYEFTATGPYSGGTGESHNPFRIGTAEDLNDIANYPNDFSACFVLVNDIDMGGYIYSTAVIAPDTSPTGGFQDTAFTGVFDGNGFKITNLTIDTDGADNDYLGLFGQIDSGEVKNLGIECYISGGDDSWFLGGLCGFNRDGTISDCYATGSVTGWYLIGGLCGDNFRDGIISNCFWDMQTSGIATSSGGTGLTTVQMTDVNTYLDAGWDFVDESANGDEDIWQIFNGDYPSLSYQMISDIPVPDITGMDIGQARTDLIAAGYQLGGIRYVYSDYIAADSVISQTPQAGIYAVQGRAIHVIVCAGPSPYSGGGTGTLEDPIRIANASDLLLLADTPNDFDKCFILTADIDLDPNVTGEPTFTTALIAPDTDNTNERFDGPPFTGVFDGNGYKITNLTIDTNGVDNDYLGLFGRIGGGEVKNLGIKGVSITGGDESSYLGGLCGYSGESTISNCYVTGDVNGDDFLGGLCGENWHGTILNCYTTGNINGDVYIGGLCGENGGTISNCYATGSVTGDSRLGGLCGGNLYGPISNCYATGSVSGDNYLGGLCGENDDGTISNCYATGSTTGGDHSDYIGGLCGENDDGIISNCFATGNVNGYKYLGGLCGLNRGTISNCYATGIVSGDDNLGGLCGLNRGTISNCYATGSLSGGYHSEKLGGLIGYNASGYYTSCFWDSE